MAPILELAVVVIALLIGVGALIRRLIVRAAHTPHLHEVEARFACPKTGSDVDCVLIDDTVTGQLAGVKTCSRFGPNAAPQCEQHCVQLINIGIGLRAKDDPAPPELTPEASLEGQKERAHEL